MRQRWAVVLAVACVVAAVGLAAQERPAESSNAAAPAIVGIWELDKDASDLPDRAAAGRLGAGESPARPGGGMGGRGGGIGGRGGGIGLPPGMGGLGGRRDPEEMQRSLRLLADLSRPPDTLTIVESGATVIVTTGEGRSVKHPTDGKEQERLTGDGLIKSKARWDGEQLRIEERIQDGPKVTRTYMASSDRRHLIITVRIEGGGIPRETIVHHVFTRRDTTARP